MWGYGVAAAEAKTRDLAPKNTKDLSGLSRISHVGKAKQLGKQTGISKYEHWIGGLSGVSEIGGKVSVVVLGSSYQVHPHIAMSTYVLVRSIKTKQQWTIFNS